MSNGVRKERITDVCAYKDCTNGRLSTQSHLYRFPRADDPRYDFWIQHTGNPILKNWTASTLRNAGLCEVHFDQSSFRENGKLKRDAIPLPFYRMEDEQIEDMAENSVDESDFSTESLDTDTPSSSSPSKHVTVEPSSPFSSRDVTVEPSPPSPSKHVTVEPSPPPPSTYVTVGPSSPSPIRHVTMQHCDHNYVYKLTDESITDLNRAEAPNDAKKSTPPIVNKIATTIPMNSTHKLSSSGFHDRITQTDVELGVPKQSNNIQQQLSANEELQNKNSNLRSLNVALEAEITARRVEIRQLRIKLRRALTRINCLKDKCRQPSIENFLDENKCMEPAARAMVKLQLHRKKAQFSNNEKHLAKMIFCRSAEIYKELLNEGCNLPGRSTVQMWIANSVNKPESDFDSDEMEIETVES